MKMLVFQHAPYEHPWLITAFAKDHNIFLEIIELWKPYVMPSIFSYDGLTIMGGPMGVYDDREVYPSKDDEVKVIKAGLGKIPMLGFCLGSQLLAHALGADVHPNIQDGKQIKEIGYYQIDITVAGRHSPIVQGFSPPVTILEWHGDAFELAQDASLLATFPRCRNQALSYKNVFGLLFHCEFTPGMVAKQIETDRQWIHADNELNEEDLLREAHKQEDTMKVQSDRLLRNFLSVITAKVTR